LRLKTNRASYEYVEIDGQRVKLVVGFLGEAGGLTVEVKESHSQQPLPGDLQPHLPLDHGEEPRMVA